MTTDHALDAAICAVCDLEQGGVGVYTDTYGNLSVELIRGQYVVIVATGWYRPAFGNVVDVDWSDGIDELMGAAA